MLTVSRNLGEQYKSLSVIFQCLGHLFGTCLLASIYYFYVFSYSLMHTTSSFRPIAQIMIRQVLRSGLYQCVVHYFQRAPPPNQTTRPTAAALQVMPLYRTHYMQIILRALHPFLFSQYGDIIGKEVSLVLVWIPLVAPPTLKL